MLSVDPIYRFLLYWEIQYTLTHQNHTTGKKYNENIHLILSFNKSK